MLLMKGGRKRVMSTKSQGSYIFKVKKNTFDYFHGEKGRVGKI